MRKILNYISAFVFAIGVIIAVLLLLSDMPFKFSSALIIYAACVTLSSLFWGVGYIIKKIQKGKVD